MVNDAEADLTADPPDQTALATLEMSLREKLTVLDELDAEIIVLLDTDEAVVEDVQQSDAVKRDVHKILVRIKQLTSTTPTAPRPAAAATPAASSVKLPKLMIDTFRGDPTKWTTFWDSFKTTVDTNSSLSGIEKFSYLKSFLQGTALEAISGFALTTANYAKAVEVLEERFGDKQLIISRHMDALMKLAPVTCDHHLRDLRKLYDSAETHIRSLQSLGISSDTYGSLLSPVLLAKLPPEMRLIISREVGASNLDTDKLLKTFSKELLARERANPAAGRHQVNPNKPEKRSPPTSSVLMANHRISDDHCAFCQQAHPSSNCSVVVTIEARRHALKGSGRCYNCLRRGHVSRACRSSARCQRCKARHHTSICDATEQNKPPSLADTGPGLRPEAPPFQSKNKDPKSTALTACSHISQAVFLQTARTVIKNPKQPKSEVEVRVLLDGGSQRSYISERAQRQLQLDSTDEHSLSIATFGSTGVYNKVCPMVEVDMCLKGYPALSLSLYVIPSICEPITSLPLNASHVSIHSHLIGFELADYCQSDDNLPVDLLIGADYYWDLVTGNVCRGYHGPTAIHTKLGWVLSGPSESAKPTHCSMNVSVTHMLHAEASLENQLREFWELEAFGVLSSESSVMENFHENISFTGERYQVSLPWKDPHPELPDNRELCAHRLQGLLRRLKRQPDGLAEYDSIIQNQIKNGIVETVEAESQESTAVIHYIPHHAVFRRDKDTTKVRIVYDASSKQNGPSLNECLHTGPKFHQKMFDLLLRFRSFSVAFTADIEKAFHMVQVAEKDRDALRFLWVRNVTDNQPEVVELRFTRVVFGVTASPFLLNGTIHYHLDHCDGDPVIVDKLKRAFYVDDVVTGAHNEREALTLYQTAKSIMKEAGFNLRKFISNSPILQVIVDQNETSNSQPVPPISEADESYANATLGASQEQSVLGVRWDTLQDEFVMSIEGIASAASSITPTKRSVVSLVGKFYDPLGFISPVIIIFKIFLQELCEAQLNWDETLAGELLTKWQRLSQSLTEGRQVICIPRCVTDQNEIQTSHSSRYQLRGFCDASCKAYAAVVYLLRETDDGYIVHFLTSKTRVAPIKRLTIPRLELLSALLLARLISSITEALKDELQALPCKCFADSTVALHWIKGVDKCWKPFIHNRVTEIRKIVPSDLWSHCAGKENPADLPSRGVTMNELATSELWMKGPPWLKSKTEEFQELPAMPTECLSELRSGAPQVTHTVLAVNDEIGVDKIINCEDFSSLQRLLAVTAQVMKFGEILLAKVRRSNDNSERDNAKSAETKWLLVSQRSLPTAKNFKQLRSQFGLFQGDDHLWRCRGRLQNTSLPISTIHPILLDKKHYVTTLIIRSAHKKVMHCGVKATLTELRARFWIVTGRSAVQQVIRNCPVCKRHDSQAYQAPPPPPLPLLRVEEAPPFCNTGVDFAGPLYIKDVEGKKVWICLFTCCVVRAVHLELVTELSAPTFLLCLKRFVARRGLPTRFLSDNGKTFVAASKTIKDIVSHPDVQAHLEDLKVKWTFNMPKAPWWGGVFERLIKSVKRCLRKTIGKARLTLDELNTALVEVEAVVNSRPLTYITAEDMDEPLTPTHLLVGRRLLSFPDHICSQSEDFEVTPELLTRRAKYLNKVITHFWDRWRREYLVELRERHRYQAQQKKTSDQISEGDVVLVHDSDLPRGFWRLGRVLKLVVGRDGQIRGAALRVAMKGKTGRFTTIHRALQLLYPLESVTPGDTTASTPTDSSSQLAENSQTSTEPRSRETNVDEPHSPEPSRRPLRKTAQRAEYRWRKLRQDLEDD